MKILRSGFKEVIGRMSNNLKYSDKLEIQLYLSAVSTYQQFSFIMKKLYVLT